MSKLVQCHLKSDTKETVAWLEPKIKVGNQITLKDSDEPERLWEFLSIGEPRDKTDIHRGWNNNR